MGYAKSIISRFGGVRAAARALSLPPTTISNWVRVGYIPAKKQEYVLRCAISLGIEISPSDFFGSYDLPRAFEEAENVQAA